MDKLTQLAVSELQSEYTAEKPPAVSEASRFLNVSDHMARKYLKAAYPGYDHKKAYAHKKCKLCEKTLYLSLQAKYCDKCRKVAKSISNKRQKERSKVSKETKKPISLFARKCTDCGCPTNDYRCEKCWAIKRGGDPNTYADKWTSGVLRVLS